MPPPENHDWCHSGYHFVSLSQLPPFKPNRQTRSCEACLAKNKEKNSRKAKKPPTAVVPSVAGPSISRPSIPRVPLGEIDGNVPRNTAGQRLRRTRQQTVQATPTPPIAEARPPRPIRPALPPPPPLPVPFVPNAESSVPRGPNTLPPYETPPENTQSRRRGREDVPEPEGADERPVQRRRGRPRVAFKAYGHRQWYDPNMPRNDMGSMSHACDECGALHWACESTNAVDGNGQSHTLNSALCCAHGDVQLELQHTPREMIELWIGTDDRSKHFRQHTRKYNNSLQFTSSKYNEDQRLNHLSSKWSTLCVHGQVFHYQGQLTEADGEKPVFLQLFLHDPDYASEVRQLYHFDIEPRRRQNLSAAQLQAYYRQRQIWEMHRGLQQSITRQLDILIRELNPWVGRYKHAKEMLAQSIPADGVTYRMLFNPRMELIMEELDGQHRGRHNLPTAPEVALIIPDELDDGRLKGPRDLVLAKRVFNQENEEQSTEGHLQTIHVSHAGYIPLAFPVLYPQGENGWHWGLKLQAYFNNKRKRDRLSQRHWYRYHTHIRHSVTALENGARVIVNERLFNPVFHAGTLFQQFLVDSWAAVEETNLYWLRNNQDQLRSDIYRGLADALGNGDDDFNAARTGKQVILPSSHLGSERAMQQLYQDAMAIVRKLGRPDWFLTMTCNPTWPEITKALLPGQVAMDRPDIVARVFNEKKYALIEDLKAGCLGVYVAHVMTIEYQKRGLPHMHLLLKTSHKDHPLDTPEGIDQVVCAELPDRSWDPDGKLEKIVVKSMTHSPCGEFNPKAPCMHDRDGYAQPICSKSFPKHFQETTVIPENGTLYPLYRRRNNGTTYTVKNPLNPREDLRIDNRWVVPYNPYLLKKYECHINVERCNDMSAVKYVFKYIHKGNDRATLNVDDGLKKDEIHQHVAARYIGAIEALWRLNEYKTHQSHPPVTRLAVHLEDQQAVYYNAELTSQQVIEQMGKSSSTLMAWFDFNRRNAIYKGVTVPAPGGGIERHHQDLSSVLYQDFPQWATIKDKVWCVRKMKKDVPLAQQSFKCIGRMYHASINSGERYYLRMLLTVIPGATSYEYLRTTDDGIIHHSFRAACIARGLVENDGEWVRLFDEARVSESGDQMRNTFIVGLRLELIASPAVLWEAYKADFGDQKLLRDLQRRRVPFPPDLQHPEQDYALYLIQTELEDTSQFTLDHFGLPHPQHNWANLIPELGEDYNPEEEARLAALQIPTLNDDQKRCFDEIVAAVNNTIDRLERLFYLQGPGGSGKTYLYTTLCHYFRGEGKTVLCVASTGIAALLLPGGSTSHSTFGLPLDLSAESISGIKMQSKKADILRKVDLIIWDEVPMQHKLCFEVVHRLFCDLFGKDFRNTNLAPFAGIVAVLGGDFAQILPVVPKGNRHDVVHASLQRLWIWGKTKKLNLRVNMRLRNDPDDPHWLEKTVQFRDWIRRVPYETRFHGGITLPGFIQQPHSIDVLVSKIYPQTMLQEAVNQGFDTPFQDRCILTTRNATVSEINKHCFDQMPGVTKTAFAVDTQEGEDATGAFAESIENLHAVELPSLPPAVLRLKIGMPLMLMRNLLQRGGLCNGTRMIVTNISRWLLEVMIVGGQFHGTVRHIPRIPLTSNTGELPYVLRRKQFPVRPCFAMTINKSQGQSFVHVGVDLRLACFSHGQFYVALSRTSEVKNLFVMIPEGAGDNGRITMNVVYPEVLKNIN